MCLWSRIEGVYGNEGEWAWGVLSVWIVLCTVVYVYGIAFMEGEREMGKGMFRGVKNKYPNKCPIYTLLDSG